MERFVETVKDRLECFDDYFHCPKEACECDHVKNWFSLYALIYNHFRNHMTLRRPPTETSETWKKPKIFKTYSGGS